MSDCSHLHNLIDRICSEKLYVDDRGNLYGKEYEAYLSNNTGVWQHPLELAHLLVWLSDKQIKSFLNIGTFNGLTFNIISSYLRELVPDVDCLSIDYYTFHNPVKLEGLRYEIMTSDDLIGHKYDLVFIDGDHTYEWANKDFINVGQYSRYCVFHDINDKYVKSMDCGGCTRYYNEIKALYSHHEFIYNAQEVMGIGLLEIN